MARLISSLKKYFVDLWKRCFAKEYLVKAEGASEAIHDFRKCAECGEHIKSIDLEWKESKCKKCKSIILKDGIYIDKKERSFRLAKPLYSRIVAILRFALIIDIILVICIFRVRHVPSMYSITPSYFLFFYSIAIVSIMMIAILRLINTIEKIVGGGFIAEATGLVAACVIVCCFAYLMVSSVYPIRNSYITPFWTKIPTQQEVYNEQLSNLEKMPLMPERFKHAIPMQSCDFILNRFVSGNSTNCIAIILNLCPKMVRKRSANQIRGIWLRLGRCNFIRTCG